VKNVKLLVLAIVVLGIYVLPSAVARIAGSHTWERNSTGDSVANLRCDKCHQYIIDEINNNITDDAVTGHLGAVDNSDLMNETGAPLNFTSRNGTFGKTVCDADCWKVCILCHRVQKDTEGATSSHTQITIRVCTDCHGNSTDVGQIDGPYDSNMSDVGRKLSNDTDMHNRFFDPLEGASSNYVTEGGTDTVGDDGTGNYTAGFYACLACHTHVSYNKKVRRPNKFFANFTIETDGSSTLDTWGVEANYSNSTSEKTGSPWA
jgi:hypothetical protein